MTNLIINRITRLLFFIAVFINIIGAIAGVILLSNDDYDNTLEIITSISLIAAIYMFLYTMIFHRLRDTEDIEEKPEIKPFSILHKKLFQFLLLLFVFLLFISVAINFSIGFIFSVEAGIDVFGNRPL